VLHQVPQWHHRLASAGHSADGVGNLRINTLADGLFHASAYAFVLAGLAVLWRSTRRTHLRWSGTLLMGFGLFSPVEGTVDHHPLGTDCVDETVPREQRVRWDVGFLLRGAAMLAGGWFLLQRAGQRETPNGAAVRG